MINALVAKLWGAFESKQECYKFIRLSLIFSFIIGVYWVLNPSKDVIFFHTVGADYFSWAKIVSLFVMAFVLLLYAKLVDLFPRHQLFYIICFIYGSLALLFCWLIFHPTIGIANAELSPYRLLGWLWYSFVESFGSLIVALFWTFASDISTPESAKKGFSIVALGAQFGGVLGPLLFYNSAKVWNPGWFALVGAIGIFLIAFFIFLFMKFTPSSELVGFDSIDKKSENKKPSAGFFEGLRLIFSSGYLFGIVTVVMLSEVIATVIELYVKTFAWAEYPEIHDLSSFLFRYAIFANGIALLSLLFGIGAIGRSFGLLKTLLLLPILVAVGILLIVYNPTLNVTLFVFVAFKGLNYALNQPAKEQLYIPTSREAKYKAKAWIDTFGSRTAKGVGSSIHMLRPMMQAFFIEVSAGICLGLIGIWVVAAWYVGTVHAKAIKDNAVIR